MKTAAEYLRAQLGDPTAFVSYATALAAVQAALDEAGHVRDQVRQGIADYFGDVLPLPELPQLPADTPPIRLGERLFDESAQRTALARKCWQCGASPAACQCEQPPF